MAVYKTPGWIWLLLEGRRRSEDETKGDDAKRVQEEEEEAGNRGTKTSEQEKWQVTYIAVILLCLLLPRWCELVDNEGEGWLVW